MHFVYPFYSLHSLHNTHGRAHTFAYRVVFAVYLKYPAARWLFPKIDKYLAISSSLDAPNGIRHQCYSMNIVHCVCLGIVWIEIRQRMHNYLACTLYAPLVWHFRVIETEITKALHKVPDKVCNKCTNKCLALTLSLSLSLSLDLPFLLIIVDCNWKSGDSGIYSIWLISSGCPFCLYNL